jgi:hypothetical protein
VAETISFFLKQAVAGQGSTITILNHADPQDSLGKASLQDNQKIFRVDCPKGMPLARIDDW